MKRKEKKQQALWSARFESAPAELMVRFNSSVSFDCRLAPYDLRASIAHARMLGATGIITQRDANAIMRGLKKIGTEISAGRFKWKIADEDVHTAIERRLIKLIGDVGMRLHTARSRNDQVATDIRLWLREAGCTLQSDLIAVRRALLSLARAHTETIMPGMTHLQIAQPTTFGHHLHAHEQALARDTSRLADAIARANVMPLGSAAFAGTTFPINRKMTARELGFASIASNTADAVASRDFAIEFASAAAIALTNLSRLCEEIVLWSSPGFDFVAVADAYCTGSSIMPQKRNPDAAELIRGKSGRVAGNVAALLMMVKSQPLAYNKDNQEDKEALFDSYDTLHICLEVAAGMISTLSVNKKAMASMAQKGFATATDLADLLVRRGVPFRRAHGMVAAAVRIADKSGCRLDELPDADLHKTCGLSKKQAAECLSAAASVRARSHYGAPAARQLRLQLKQARSATTADLAVVKKIAKR